MKCIFGLLFVFSFSVQAFSQGMYIMPEFGRGEINFNSDATISGGDEEQKSATAAVIIGYKTSSNFIVGGNIGATNNETFLGLDSYQLYDVGPFMGYSIELTKNFHIVPIVGVNFWELDAEEGEFLNSGPEESRETHGSDVYWRVNFEIATEGLLDYNFSLVSGDYDFGEFYSARFGLKFKFQ